MHEQVQLGPLYDGAVQLLSTYRSVAARMLNGKGATKGKLDRRLEKLSERISERLGELSDMERLALTCWKPSIMPDTYEVDHDQLTTKPYVSIRRVDRVIDEYDVDERRELERAAAKATEQSDGQSKARLKSFISKLNEGL